MSVCSKCFHPAPVRERIQTRFLADIVFGTSVIADEQLTPIFSKRRILYLGGAALFLGLFIKFASELIEGEVAACDKAVLAWVTAHRRPAMNVVAVDVTALGSKTVLSLLTVVGLLGYAVRRRWGEALYLSVGMAALPLWIYGAKHYFLRPRPPPEMRLMAVFEFSYPSGHSTAATVFYLLLAVLMCRRFPARRTQGFFLSAALIVILMVCLSRIYLGVHYPSDVLSGFFLGSAWVLFLTAFLSRNQKSMSMSISVIGLVVAGYLAFAAFSLSRSS